jgi:hypothetical protein
MNRWIAGCVAAVGCASLGLLTLTAAMDRGERLLTGAPRLLAPASRPAPPQQLPFHPYDGSWTFVRIRTAGGFGRFRGFRGWSHDYPDAERNLSRIVDEFTGVDTRLVASGGNVLTFDDPRLGQFPFAYVSEPDEWRTTPEEAAALRDYLLRGGFVVFDDFFEWEMENLVRQMRQVFPELAFLPLDGSEEIWDSFFALDPLNVVLEGPRKSGTPRFWGLFEGNDKRGRMLAVAGAGGDIGDLWEWSDRGYFPIDPTNEAYRIGINYIVYALTH